MLELTDAGAAALAAAGPEVDRFNAGLRAALGTDGFSRAAGALRTLTRWEPPPRRDAAIVVKFLPVAGSWRQRPGRTGFTGFRASKKRPKPWGEGVVRVTPTLTASGN
ncbi:hypothetical protein ACQ4WX_08975 [Streptomyces lasalocidi]